MTKTKLRLLSFLVLFFFLFLLLPVNAQVNKTPWSSEETSRGEAPREEKNTGTVEPIVVPTLSPTNIPNQKREMKQIIRKVIDKELTLDEAAQLIEEKGLKADCGRVVDDSDKENGCYITWSSWNFQASGYLGTSEYVTQVPELPVSNEASWVTHNLNETVEVKMSVPSAPNVPGKFVTSVAEVFIQHEGGITRKFIDQLRNQGEVVSLGEYEFGQLALIYVTNFNIFGMDDLVLADMVAFGEDELPPDLDIAAPEIKNVKNAFNENNAFIIEAEVTDDKSGVRDVYALLNGVTALMEKNPGTNTYSAIFAPGSNRGLSYQIVATDNAGNEAIWDLLRGYLSRASFAQYLGFPEWAFYPDIIGYLSNAKSPCVAGNICNSGYVGDPVNTYNGNLVETIKVVNIPGRPEIDFHITYNSLGGRPSTFGENWTHSFNYNLLAMNNVHFQGAFVMYPDGHQVIYSGSTYTPADGNFDKLTKNGDGTFTLHKQDKTKIKFNNNGNVKRIEDIDGNGLTFEYTTQVPNTLLSQITKIVADGGRYVDILYNSEGLVEKVAAAEGKEIRFEYDNDDLVKMIDGNGGETIFEYNADHSMTRKISPKGHNYLVNTYDAEGRVETQTTGAGFYSSFDYQEVDGKKVVTVTDAYNKATKYTYAEGGLLEKIEDPEGYIMRYEYDTENKKVIKEIDKDGNETVYDYDDYGNLTYEKDPYGYEVTREYNLDYHKPTKEIYKQSDHVTKWEYSETGHMTKMTNALNAFKEFKYNNLGQLTESKDYNGNKTTYTYTPEGDIKTETDALGKTITYFYDGLGRLIKTINKRGFELTYTYDSNDNLKQINGINNYKVVYEYDLNNNKTKVIDPLNHATEYFYDTSENLVKVKNALGFETTNSYGLMNELLSTTDAEGRITKYEYDNLYTVKKMTTAFGTPDEAVTLYEYNGMRNTTKVTDANNVVTKFVYNKLQLKTEQIVNYIEGGPINSTTNVKTTYEYSPAGVLIKQIDPNNNATVNELDALDRVKKITDAENQITEYTYDNQGNVELVKNPRGYTIEYSYDDLNRKTTSTDSLSQSTSYFYDENNNLIFMQDANGIYTRYIYDEFDRKVEEIKNFVNEAPASPSVNVKTKYEYDLAGNLKKIINPRGYETEYIYDAINRNTEVIDAYDKTTSYLYDKVNNIRKVTDRNNNQIEYFYDNLNRVEKSVDQEGFFEEYAYDDLSNMTEKINKRGKIYSFQYDSLNRLKKLTNPLNYFVEYTYDAVGNKLTAKDENGHITTYTYDKVNRLKTVKDPENNITQNLYDKNGNVEKLIDAENNSTVYEYDKIDRLVSVTNAELEKEEYAYDKMLNRTMRIEADGTKHKFEYDQLYRLTKVIDNYRADQPAGNDVNVETEYKYDANGNNIEVYDPNNSLTKFVYDNRDRLKEEINPLNKKWIFSYDNENNLVSRIDANNVTTSYEYYPDYQLKKTIYPNYTVEYQYNKTNMPTQMNDQLGSTSWQYDALDRLTNQNDALEREISYTYDPAHNLTRLNYADGKFIEHTYFKNNWAKTTTSSDQESLTFTRNKVGATTYIQRSNSSYSSINYDKVYRPLFVDDHQQQGGNHLIHTFEYTYNDVGHIITEVANYGWRQPQQVTTNNQYDGLHRITQAQSSDGQNSTYAYDAAGNRTVQTEATQQGLITKTFAYNYANQITTVDVDAPQNPDNEFITFSYDNNGNRISRLREGNGVDQITEYHYDIENRLTKVRNRNENQFGGEITLGEYSQLLAQPSTTDIRYDGNGRALAKDFYAGNGTNNPKTTEYVYDRKDPIAEYDLWNNQRRDYFRDQDQNLWMFQKLTGNNVSDKTAGSEYVQEDMYTGKELYLVPPGTMYFYHYDGEGNIGATSKHSAQSDHAYRYDEYGAVLPENGNWTTPHNEYTLNQKEVDTYTGLVYFGARYYDPEFGVWITQDTYRGEFNNPMSLHRYMYNYNSPINYQDEYGYSPNQVGTVEQVSESSSSNWLDTYKQFTRYCNNKRAEMEYYNNLPAHERLFMVLGGEALAFGDWITSTGIDLIQLNSEFNLLFGEHVLGLGHDDARMKLNVDIVNKMDQWRLSKDNWLLETAGIGDEVFYKDDSFLGGIFNGIANMQYLNDADTYNPMERGFLGGRIFTDSVEIYSIVKGAASFAKSGYTWVKGLGSSADNVVGVLDDGARMTNVRNTGKAGEAASGIIKNTKHIESLTGTAKYRIPDGLNHSEKLIQEVKNVKRLSYTDQLKDFVAYSQKEQYRFELFVRPDTDLASEIQALEKDGVIIIRYLPE